MLHPMDQADLLIRSQTCQSAGVPAASQIEGIKALATFLTETELMIPTMVDQVIPTVPDLVRVEIPDVLT
jgi:hypothetical protein